MQSLNKETVFEIIRLAEECYPNPDQWEGASIRDAAEEILETFRETGEFHKPEHIALVERLKRLSHDELKELVALMWLGRGDAGERAEDWESLLEDASRELEHSPVAYVVEKMYLARYLRDGLEKLAIGGDRGEGEQF